MAQRMASAAAAAPAAAPPQVQQQTTTAHQSAQVSQSVKASPRFDAGEGKSRAKTVTEYYILLMELQGVSVTQSPMAASPW